MHFTVEHPYLELDIVFQPRTIPLDIGLLLETGFKTGYVELPPSRASEVYM